MFFDNWFGLLRVVVVGTLAYAALVAPQRVSGKRTLSKLNAFDLVVTVALGSTVATVLLSKHAALAEGLLAFALLAGPQWAVAKLSLRSPRFGRLVKAEPRLPPHRGGSLDGALRAWRTPPGWPRRCLEPTARSTWSATRRRKRAPSLKGVVGRESRR